MGALGASICQVGRCLLLMLRTFRALGNPCRLLGSTLRRRPGGVSFSLVSPLGWRVSTSCSGRVARSGWAQGWESFILLKGFSAQWGSSQIKRHLYCRVLSAVIKTAHGVFPGTRAAGRPGVRPGIGETRGSLSCSSRFLLVQQGLAACEVPLLLHPLLFGVPPRPQYSPASSQPCLPLSYSGLECFVGSCFSHGHPSFLQTENLPSWLGFLLQC